jgi:RHS repeat-associated protein
MRKGGPPADEIFTRTDSSGTANFLTDALGSTLALTSSSGSTLAQYAYEPFGNTFVTSGSSANSYEYTGRENDGTGLNFNRARYYSAALQRFISEDPVRLAGGINGYAYVDDDPLDSTDPSGLGPRKGHCNVWYVCSKNPFHSPSPVGRYSGSNLCTLCAGNAPNPNYYFSLGQSADWIQNDIHLLDFHRGGPLDAQAYGAGTGYANYVFGVYMAGAGYSLSDTLDAAAWYAAAFSRYPSTTQMDPNYPTLPAKNVTNITNGFHEARNGTF